MPPHVRIGWVKALGPLDRSGPFDDAKHNARHTARSNPDLVGRGTRKIDNSLRVPEGTSVRDSNSDRLSALDAGHLHPGPECKGPVRGRHLPWVEHFAARRPPTGEPAAVPTCGSALNLQSRIESRRLRDEFLGSLASRRLRVAVRTRSERRQGPP